MELTIDGLRCDLAAPCAVPGYDFAAAASPDTCRTGRTLTLELPATPRNDDALRRARDPHAAAHFNAATHRAELREEGALLLAGGVRLLQTTEEGYRIEIREGGAGWAREAARRDLAELGFDLSMRLDPTTICRSWTETGPVKFFPVVRDAWPAGNSPQDLLPDERMLSTDDYHPFFHVATLTERIFAEAGYAVRSRFFASELFRSLYLSGSYGRRDTAAIEARMGFRARRTAAATAEADDAGRVAADPKALAHTVGNLVDTASTGAVDADGEPIDGLYNHGGCLATRDGALRFTPTAEVDVGFEYALRYTTEHRILDRTRLGGFDTIYLGPGSEASCPLANRYVDRRTAVAPGRSYRAIVFDHAPGARYRLRYTRNGTAGVLWAEFSERTARVETPAAGTVAAPALEVLAGGAWQPYGGDWALYDGHVEERGTTTVAVTLRSAARRAGPTSPVRFDLVYFGGAEPGMRLTLHKECALRPTFHGRPGFGATVAFADMLRGGIRQGELLAALAHLFNLRFATDRERRTVRIEPRDMFYDAGEADWSDRTDFAHPVRRRMLAPDHAERRTWCYAAGDGPVRRLEAEEGRRFGAWSRTAASLASKEGEEVARNPLFAPSLTEAGRYANAPSARLLAVGDRDDDTGGDPFDPPRLVCFAGLHPLPPDERWGHPWGQASYPLAAFHFAGSEWAEPFTLGFDNRDGVEGLHRFRDRQADEEDLGEEIDLRLQMAPHEFEALRDPDAAAGLRSVWRIDTGEGLVRAVVERVGEYDPARGSVRCLLRRLAQDPETP